MAGSEPTKAARNKPPAVNSCRHRGRRLAHSHRRTAPLRARAVEVMDAPRGTHAIRQLRHTQELIVELTNFFKLGWSSKILHNFSGYGDSQSAVRRRTVVRVSYSFIT